MTFEQLYATQQEESIIMDEQIESRLDVRFGHTFQEVSEAAISSVEQELALVEKSIATGQAELRKLTGRRRKLKRVLAAKSFEVGPITKHRLLLRDAMLRASCRYEVIMLYPMAAQTVQPTLDLGERHED